MKHIKPASVAAAIRRRWSPAKAIRREAAEWLALREARGFILSEHAAFAEWCAADPRHAAVFSEVESAWRTFDRLAAYPHSADLADDPDLLAASPQWRSPSPGPRLPAAGWRAVQSGLLAAAAACVVALVLWLRPWGPLQITDASPADIVQVVPNLLRLPDGSTVELNAGSNVIEAFTVEERRVRLVHGEAHFTVAKNAERPFIVEAAGVAVRAVGTAFNVRLDPANVEVVVTEGTVRIDAPSPATETASSLSSREPRLADGKSTQVDSPSSRMTTPTVLVANQRALIPTLPLAESVQPVVETLSVLEIDRVLAWQSSRFVFDDLPLADVVAHFNRHAAGQKAPHRVTVRDAQLGGLRISGRVRSDNLQNFIEVLESTFGVVAERGRDGEIVLRHVFAPQTPQKPR
ncbi:MAG: FecR family protein [Opitutaceae bacterium]